MRVISLPVHPVSASDCYTNYLNSFSGLFSIKYGCSTHVEKLHSIK